VIQLFYSIAAMNALFPSMAGVWPSLIDGRYWRS
jgi:hypothetical protein